MPKTVFVVVCAAVVASNDLSAQQKAQQVWKATADVGANILYGASRSRVVSVALGGSRVDSIIELRSDVALTYADARVDDEPRRVTARSWRISMTADHTPRRRVSLFELGSVDASLQQRVDRRYALGAGGKVTYYRKGTDDVSTSLAVLWERTRALDPDSSTDSTITRARWSLRGRIRRQLGPVVRFTHVTFYQPAIDQLAIYIVDSNTSFEIKIDASKSLTATWRERFDSEARARGARSNRDGQVLFGVHVSIP